MTDSIIRLTKSEEEIMKMFWERNGELLTSSEVVEASPNRNWKASSVHLLLNGLLNKGVIEVSGFKRTTKNYARTFQPSLSKTEYMLGKMDNKMKEEAFFALLADMDTEVLKRAKEEIETKLK